MRFKAFLVVILLCSGEAANYQDSFPNFSCASNGCEVTGVSSSENLLQLYTQLATNSFEYASNYNDYNCRNHGRGYCRFVRLSFELYTEITFVDSTFSKFPSGDFTKLNHIEDLSAINVGLTEINRDDLKSFKSLQNLNLSKNNITTLGNLFLLHAEFLKSLQLQENKIAQIDALAFDEGAINLEYLDLSHNQLSKISENMLNAIGKSESAELFLQNNIIAEMTPATTPISHSKMFETLNLSSNKLKSFIYNCTRIASLALDNNQLEKFETENCSLNMLKLSNNNLVNLKIAKVEGIEISNNVNLQNLSLEVGDLTSLEMENLPTRLLTYDTLKRATKLTELYAANTFMGPLKIDTLLDMSSLKYLNLSNTGLSHIEYGMFSQQKKVLLLDISGNALNSLDINMLASMSTLMTLSIRGNNLTKLDHVGTIKEVFPLLEKIRIDDNRWNCSYLASLQKTLTSKEILVEEPWAPVKDSPNVLGIGCVTSAQSKIQPLSAVQVNEAVSIKLNEIIGQINEEKAKRENQNYDFDVIKSELFSMQKEILEVRSKMVKIQLDAEIKGGTPSNASVDMSAIKSMMEQLNNLTLEKQKIAYDQLVNKLSELRIENKALQIEVDRMKDTRLPPPTENEAINYQRFQQPTQNEIRSGESKTVEYLLIVILSIAVIIACAMFAYEKLKKSTEKFSQSLMGVRARSTNTINTTIELPFSDENH